MVLDYTVNKEIKSTGFELGLQLLPMMLKLYQIKESVKPTVNNAVTTPL